MADTATIYQTRSGPMMALDTDVYVGRAIALYGEYCPTEWALLRQLIRPGSNVIEVGANMGTHSVAMARACDPGVFLAFEPQPRLFQILAGNLALNNIANALVYPEGCGDAEGEAIVPWVDYERQGNFGGVALGDAEDGAAPAPEHRGIPVRIRTIDSLGLAECRLIKIDVEGFEPRVIRGAAETIRRCRPILYVENDRAAQQQEVIDLIAAHDYRLYWHVPRLFSPDNFRGETRNIYGHTASLNMLCLPREQGDGVAGQTEIDPANWTSPIALG
jgi:FkbM family methyltransferase